mgnify:CR=1 FL=1
MQWEIVVGLETHTQLTTESKIFSGASTAFGAEPNAQACAVDLALPGVLPVMNKAAVQRAIQFGLAVGAKVAEQSLFARKNYFYPDLPKGYQISQFEIPVVQGGTVSFLLGDQMKTVRLVRAHLEEDAGKSLHEDFAGQSGIDLNRAGTPLLEIVTEPDMRSAEEAVAYAKTLHTLVTWLGICDGNMQEGSFRCDANVSVRPKGETKLGTRCEIKNLNSFKFLQAAILYEAQRQIEIIEDGGTIKQETRLYDPDRNETRSMRSKEDSEDYRYFPDPDLLPLELEDSFLDECRASLPELPDAKRARYENELGLTPYNARELTAEVETFARFETLLGVAAAKIGKPEAKVATQVANWALSVAPGVVKSLGEEADMANATAEAQAAILAMQDKGEISGGQAKEIYEIVLKTGRDPEEIADSEGLKQVSDTGAIETAIDEILADNEDKVEQYRGGKDKLFGFFVGQTMKAMQGKANPSVVNQILKDKLG